MRRFYSLIILAVLSASGKLMACSCVGAHTFCETIDPNYVPPIFPGMGLPSNIVLGIRLATVDYGADVRVVQDFSGDLLPDAVIRVWGDCGVLCRDNTLGAVGDTVLWAIQHCDLAGNLLCTGTDGEEPSHYQLPTCGVFRLNYANGIVSGPLFTEGVVESVSIAAFPDLVHGCMSTGVEAIADLTADIRYFDGRLSIRTAGNWSAAKQVCITDAGGRLVHEADFRGPQGSVLLPRRLNGLMLVRVNDGARSIAHKILFD